MRKLRMLGYITLVVAPIAIACSVGTDNPTTYFFAGNLRNEAKLDLVNNYWANVDEAKVSEVKKNVLASLLKESGVGITLSHMSINSIWEGTNKVITPNPGDTKEATGSVLFDCQIELPTNLTDEEKKTVKTPNPAKCDETYEELKPYLNDKYRTHLNITYKGSKKYATKEIPKGEEVFFCAITKYDNTNDKFTAKIEELRDGKCQ